MLHDASEIDAAIKAAIDAMSEERAEEILNRIQVMSKDLSRISKEGDAIMAFIADAVEDLQKGAEEDGMTDERRASLSASAKLVQEKILIYEAGREEILNIHGKLQELLTECGLDRNSLVKPETL